ncbi:hypothetical protein BaDB11_00037 [Bacillus licheniformis]|nr:hypothetical protein BaDB11_00037 [Bacillus licheniformis]
MKSLTKLIIGTLFVIGSIVATLYVLPSPKWNNTKKSS